MCLYFEILNENSRSRVPGRFLNDSGRSRGRILGTKKAKKCAKSSTKTVVPKTGNSVPGADLFPDFWGRERQAERQENIAKNPFPTWERSHSGPVVPTPTYYSRGVGNWLIGNTGTERAGVETNNKRS